MTGDDVVTQRHTITVLPDAASVRAARHRVGGWLRDVGRADADTAALLLSELLTNVVLHAGTPASVRITVEGDCLRVVVSDGAASLPTRRHPGPDAVTGRGLQIVDAVADAWGVERLVDGKSVWFELTDSGAR